MPKHSIKSTVGQWVLDSFTPFEDDERSTDDLQWTKARKGSTRNRRKSVVASTKSTPYKKQNYRTKVCKYGEKCHFSKIGGCYFWHPTSEERICKTTCKKVGCNDKDCKYTHLPLLTHKKTRTPCRFGDRCLRALCPFMHIGEDEPEVTFNLPGPRAYTKKCRYGSECKRKVCFYAHSRKELRDSHRHEEFGEVPCIGSSSDRLSGSMSSRSSESECNTEEIANDIVNEVLTGIHKVDISDDVVNGFQCTAGQFISTAHNQIVAPDFVLDPDIAVYQSTGLPKVTREIKNLTVGVIKVGDLVTTGNGYAKPVVCSTGQPELRMFEGRLLLMYSYLPTKRGSCGQPVYMDGQVIGLHVISNSVGPIKCNYAIPVGTIGDQIDEREVHGKLQIVGTLQGGDGAIKREDNPPVQETDTLSALAELPGMITQIGGAVAGLSAAATGIAGFFDNPAVIPPAPQQLYTVDIPREVYTTGFKKDDYVGDQSDCVSSANMMGTSFRERCMIPSRIAVKTWTTSQVDGTQLAYFPVSPMLCEKFLTAGEYSYWDTTMLAGAATNYMYWRGSIRFHIEAFPTSFHQGQLYVCFNPNPQPADITFSSCWTLGGASIDLSVNNSTTFEVPFVYPKDYCVVRAMVHDETIHGTEQPLKEIVTTGYIYIFVQNRLIASSDKVPNEIDVNISISGGEDFDCKVPKRRNAEMSHLARGMWWNYDESHVAAENSNNNNNGSEREGSTFMKVKTNVPSYYKASTSRDVDVIGSVPTATTENIFQDYYLVKNDIVINQTYKRGTRIMSEKLPGCFFPAVNAPSGISEYHALFRSDFQVKLKLSTTQFQCGCARLVFEPIQGILSPILVPTPADQNLWSSFNASSQLPHADINFNGQTECEFVIPWASVCRALAKVDSKQTNGGEIGRISLFIWNQLRSVNSTAIYGSLWVKAIDPYFSVRRIAGTLQGEEPPATSERRTTRISALDNETSGVEKYLVNDHFSPIELMRRLDYRDSQFIEVAENKNDPGNPGRNATNIFMAMVIPIEGGFTNTFIESMYAFNSGSKRLTLITTITKFQPVLFWIKYQPYTSRASVVQKGDFGYRGNAIKAGALNVDTQFGECAVVYQPAETPIKTIEFPQYTNIPVIQSHGHMRAMQYAKAQSEDRGVAYLMYQWTYTHGLRAIDFIVHAATSVGDDYMLYYPLPPPVIRMPKDKPVVEFEMIQDADLWQDQNNHCDLLLSGDIEENPGPKDLLMQFNEWGFQFDKTPDVTFSNMDGYWYCWIEVYMKDRRRMYYGTGPSKKIAKRQAVASIPDFRVQAFHQYVDELLASPDSTATGSRIHEQMVTDIFPNFGITDKVTGALSAGARSLFQIIGTAMKDTLGQYVDENKDYYLDVLRDVAVLVMFFDNVVLSHLQGKTIMYKLPLYLVALRKNLFVTKIIQAITKMTEQSMGEGYMQRIFRLCIQGLGSAVGCQFSDVTVNRAMYDFVRPSITDMGKNFYSYVSDLFKRLTSTEISLDDAVSKMTKARTHYNMRRHVFTTDKLFKNRTEFMEVYDDVKVCQPVLEKYGKPGFNYFMKEVNERYTALAKIAIGSGPRCEPVGIMLSGESGQGKSVFQTILARAMAKYLLPENERTSDAISKNIYALRPGEIEYMDGYCMQDVVTVDDALADADYKTVMPFVQLISTAPTPVAMADLADKGRYFTSKAVVISSNFDNIQGYNEIKHHEAINRRFELCYHIVCIKPKDGKLDIERLLKDFDDGDKKVWEVFDSHIAFHKYNFGNPNFITKFMKPSAVYKECMDRLKVKLGTFGNFEKLYSRVDVEDLHLDVNNSAETRICEKCETIHDCGCPYEEDPAEKFYDATLLDQLHGAYVANDLRGVLDGVKYKKVTVPMDLSLLSNEESCYDYLLHQEITDVDVICTVYWCLLNKKERSFKDAVVEIKKWITDTVSSSVLFIRKHLDKILIGAMAIIAAVGAYYMAKKVRLGERLTNLSLYFEEWYAVQENKRKLGEIIATAHRHQYGSEMLQGLLNGEIKPYKGKMEIPHWAFLEAEAMEECKEAFKKCNMEVDEDEADYWKRVISLLRRAGAVDEQSLKEGFRKPPKKITRKEHVSGPDYEFLAANCVPLYASPVDDSAVGYGFLVDNVNLLVPKHYLSAYQYVYMSVGSNKVKQEIYLPNSRVISNKDLMIVNVPPQQSVRSRVKSFVPDKTMLSQYAGYGHRVVGKLSLTTGEEDSNGVLKLCEVRRDGAVAGTEFMSLRVTKETRVGICGTPYVCGSFIMGIHVNGVGYDAGMALVTREELEDFLFPGYVEYELPQCEQYIEEKWTGNEVGFNHLGAFYGEQGDLLSANVNMTTEKVHSDMYNPVDFPDEFDVSPKNYEILFTRANKYGFHQPLGSHTVQETSFALSLYETVLANQERDISLLSDEVILNGNEEIMPLKIDSSAGHWSCISDKKKAFIDVNETPEGNWYTWSEDYYNKKHPVLGKSLHEVIVERTKLAEKGQRSPSFWVTTLKDELLLKEKVETGKTRVFEAPPLDTTILFKKYFGSFANWYRHHAGPVLSHTIGVEKEKIWGSLYSHLRRNSEYGIAADYSQFDGTIPPMAFLFFQKVVRLYYQGAPECEHKVRDVLIHELQHTTQLIGSGLYQSGKGNKSGNYLTDVFNSITNVWAWMTSFHRVYTKEIGRMPKLDDWFENVVLFTHGDDCILSLKQVLSPQKLLDEIRALGFLITSADKSEGEIKYEKVDGLTYLKSGFRQSQGIVWPPMPMATCYREVNWCKRSMRNNSTVRKTQIAEGRRFAAYHSREQLAGFDYKYKKNVHRELGLVLDPVIPESYDAIEVDVRLKQLMQDMCPDNKFNEGYLDCFISLLLDGDIESNPGPVLPRKYMLLRDILFEYEFYMESIPFSIQDEFTPLFWEWLSIHWNELLAYKWYPSLPLAEGETKEDFMQDLILMIQGGRWDDHSITVDSRTDKRRSLVNFGWYVEGGMFQRLRAGIYRIIETGTEYMSMGEPLCCQYPVFEFLVRYVPHVIPTEVGYYLMYDRRDRFFRRGRDSFRYTNSISYYFDLMSLDGLEDQFQEDPTLEGEIEDDYQEDLTNDGDIEANPGPDIFVIYFVYYFILFNIIGYYYYGEIWRYRFWMCVAIICELFRPVARYFR